MMKQWTYYRNGSPVKQFPESNIQEKLLAQAMRNAINWIVLTFENILSLINAFRMLDVVSAFIYIV